MKPSWSRIESDGASVTSFDGVIEPGSDGGAVGFAVSPEVELSVAVTVGTIRIVDGIQSLSLEVEVEVEVEVESVGISVV